MAAILKFDKSHILATAWPIIMKSGLVMHIDPLNPKAIKILNLWKFNLADTY